MPEFTKETARRESTQGDLAQRLTRAAYLAAAACTAALLGVLFFDAVEPIFDTNQRANALSFYLLATMTTGGLLLATQPEQHEHVPSSLRIEDDADTVRISIPTEHHAAAPGRGWLIGASGLMGLLHGLFDGGVSPPLVIAAAQFVLGVVPFLIPTPSALVIDLAPHELRIESHQFWRTTRRRLQRADLVDVSASLYLPRITFRLRDGTESKLSSLALMAKPRARLDSRIWRYLRETPAPTAGPFR